MQRIRNVLIPIMIMMMVGVAAVTVWMIMTVDVVAFCYLEP